MDKRLLKKVRQFFSWNAERKIVVLHREWVGFSKKIEIISYNARIFLKRALKMQMSMLEYFKFIIEGGGHNETYQIIEHQIYETEHGQRRMRRVPDFMSVCMQDFLYSR